MIAAGIRNQVVMAVSVPVEQHKEIIGRGGMGLNSFQKKHNVTIYFPNWKEFTSVGEENNADKMQAVDPESKLKVVGAQKQVEAAINELKVCSPPAS